MNQPQDETRRANGRLAEALQKYSFDIEQTGQTESAPPQILTTADDLYEEPERDTDSNAGFYEHSIEDYDEDYLDLTDHEPRFTRPLTATSAAASATEQDMDPQASNPQSSGVEPELPLEDDNPDWNEPDMMSDDYDEDWGDEDGPQGEDGDGSPTWPMGLIAVALLALVLLLAGGYGVMQQRAATQNELRELRAALATAASPEDVMASRREAQEYEQRVGELKEQLYSLSSENRRLADTVAGLEAQLAAQQTALASAPAAAKPVAAPAKAKPTPSKPVSKPKVATAKPAAIVSKPASTSSAPAAAGTWFVNFGSYGNTAIAEDWRKKLKPEQGRVITAASAKGDRTYYRVRVVDLPDKATAQRIAKSLEQTFGVSKLWVGKQS